MKRQSAQNRIKQLAKEYNTSWTEETTNPKWHPNIKTSYPDFVVYSICGNKARGDLVWFDETDEPSYLVYVIDEDTTYRCKNWKMFKDCFLKFQGGIVNYN